MTMTVRYTDKSLLSVPKHTEMGVIRSCLTLAALTASSCAAFQCQHTIPAPRLAPLHSSAVKPPPDVPTDSTTNNDAIIKIKPKLMELKQKRDTPDDPLILRMGVRNGGCSGLSYVMDFSTVDAITVDDEVDEYNAEGIRCVVDAKSVLYLYGLELDYSDELIGGGFKFYNPNAEESCGCGSSFGV